MEKIIKEALLFQILQCPMHSEFCTNYSLNEDHICSDDRMPNKCVSILKEHNEEVWIVKFSRAGNMFSTVAKNRTIIIWNFDLQEIKAKLKFKINNAHDKDIYYIDWSFDDTILLSTSADKNIKLWCTVTG